MIGYFQKHKEALLALAFLLALGFVNFSTALHNPFLIDDFVFFREKNNDWSQLKFHFLPDKNKIMGVEGGGMDISYYRPMAHIIPFLCFQLFHHETFGYHVVNVILFVVAAWLVYLFLKEISGNTKLGILAAALYLVHPINGFVVNYVTASVYSAQVIFMVLTLKYFWRYAHGRDLAWNLVASLLLFLGALSCHETSMALPFYTVCLLWFSGKNVSAIAKKCWPFFAVWGIYFIGRLQFASIKTSIFVNWSRFELSPWEYFASLGKLIGWYLGKLVLPQGIVFMWATPPARGEWGWLVVFVLLLVLFIFLIRTWGRLAASLGLVWLAIGFIPLAFGAGVTPLMGLLIEPHWFTFSSIGFFILVAHLILRFPKNWPWFAGFFLFMWLLVSQFYNFIWSDEKRYCYYMMEQAPDFQAPKYFLAQSYEKSGEYDLARYYYKKSLLNRYKDWMVYSHLGTVDYRQGKIEDAKLNLMRSLSLEPRNSEVLNILGSIYLMENDLARAKVLFLKSMESDRFYLYPRLNLATIALKQKDVAGAVRLYEDVLKISANEAAMVGLMRIYNSQKNKDRAAYMARAILVQSNNPENLSLAGVVLGQAGAVQAAVQSFQKAIKMDPQYMKAYLSLGALYAELGFSQEAKDILLRGQAINPLDTTFEQSIQRLNMSLEKGR